MIETAQIIAVGDEVLWGETINSNAAWMANFLMSFGVRPTYHCVVPDHENEIGNAVCAGVQAVDLTVIIGGLGPTADDRTLDAISHALDRELRFDADTHEHIARGHSHGPGWEASVSRQSRTLDGAIVWQNPRGQAPGQLLVLGDRFLLALPGPPREMQGICEKWLSQWLPERTARRIHRDTYSIFDLGESAVAAHVWPLLEGQHPKSGIYAQPGRVDIRIETADSVDGAILRQRSRAWIENRVPTPVFECGDRNRETFLIEWLATQRWSLAAMESITGGLLLSTLIAVPGASQSVLGGIVAYTDEVKQHHGVPRAVLQESGAVSQACALAMAEAVRREFETEVGVATTGFAGPDGGTSENPTGTFFVAAVTKQDQVVRRRYAPLERGAVRQIAVHTAISAVWELLKLPTVLKHLDTN